MRWCGCGDSSSCLWEPITATATATTTTTTTTDSHLPHLFRRWIHPLGYVSYALPSLLLPWMLERLPRHVRPRRSILRPNHLSHEQLSRTPHRRGIRNTRTKCSPYLPFLPIAKFRLFNPNTNTTNKNNNSPQTIPHFNHHNV